MKTIAHVDLDAFFAAVEQRDNPELRGQPVIIGANPRGGLGRGVVSTASYEAREFGVHSAMPISKAYRLCPQGHFLPGSSRKYRAISSQVFKIFENFTPHIQPISIDEAFLDITGSVHLFGTARNLALKIKERVLNETGMIASIGIAPVKFAAKIASDLQKPDGLVEVLPGNVKSFLADLPISRLWGAGPQTCAVLESFGIRTIGELATTPRIALIRRLGDHGRHLHDLANGIDSREVVTDDEIKSISHEHTFDQDTNRREEIEEILCTLSEKISRRLRKSELKGKTITVKIRLKSFQTYTRAVTIPDRTNYTDDILLISRQIFDKFYRRGMLIRLIGIKVTNFDDPYVQDSLYDEGNDQKEKIHDAVDQIKDRFGEDAIHRAKTS